MKEFDMMYLSGYSAERYSVPFRDVSDYIGLRARREARSRILGSERYLLSKVYRQETEVESIEAKYAMLPMYICNIEYGGEKHTVAVNGQTGKVNGTVPVDEKAVTKRNLLVGGGIGLPAVIAWLTVILPMHLNGSEVLLQSYVLLAAAIAVAFYFLLFNFRNKVHRSHSKLNINRTASEYSIAGTEKYICNDRIYNGRYDDPRSIHKDKIVYNTD